jgi:hypothetical protein
MPEPNEGETEEQFMQRCMAYPDMQKYDSEQRAAICHSKFKGDSTPASATVQLAVFAEPMQIVEDSNCCLKVQAVIAKEGVYTFPAGPKGEDKQCLWSRQELLNATRTARAAKIIVKDHPPEKVIVSQHDMYGTVEKPFFDRDRIRGILNFDKEQCPQDFLQEIRAAAAKTGPPKDVSIGFYYATDPTPGVWHGIPYDLVMRDMLIDHVAAGVWRGRCTFPNCGIGSEKNVRRFIAAASGVTVQEKKVVGGKKGLSETKPEEFLEFVKQRKIEGYTEQQAKDYWDAYVGTKELPPAPTITPPASPALPAKPVETPTIPVPPITPPPTIPPSAPEPEQTVEQLIDRSKELLKMREQSVIEKNRADRRHPL